MRFIRLYSILMVLVVSLSTMSCETGLKSISVPSHIYFPQTGNLNVVPLLGESIYTLKVYKSGLPENGGASVSVNVDKGEADNFINKNPDYQLLPDEFYSLLSSRVEFSKGEESKPIDIQFKGISPTFVEANYVLPLRLQNTTGGAELIENKSLLYIVVTRYRNPYEGEYRIYGTATRENGTTAKIETETTALSTASNTIKVQGAENSMKLHLTIENGNVTITGAPGSEDFQIKNTEGKASTYTGTFDPNYQRDNGTFQLYYSYVVEEKVVNVAAEMKFWL